MKYLLIALLVTSYAQAVNFSQPDKQSHALLGCSGALLTRGAAEESGSQHETLWGIAGGIGAGLAYEAALAAPKTNGERVQDVLAAGIGSLACVEVAAGIKLMVMPSGLSAGGNF